MSDGARDRAEISELLYRYARAIDTRDFAALSRVFTPDASIYYGPAGGLELEFPKLVEWLRGALQIFCRTQHMVSNPLIELAGDRARSTCSLIASHVQVRHDGSEHLVAEGGTYSDEHVRTPHGWRIRARRLDRIWQNGAYLGPKDIRLFERPGDA